MAEGPPERTPLIYRHRLVTRLWHWVNAIALLIMVGSGLMIFNAHPGSIGGSMAPISTMPGWSCRASRAG